MLMLINSIPTLIVDEIAKLFPSLFGQPSAMLKPCDPSGALPDKSLKIGVVLSGGQAPGGHNVISGIFGNMNLTMFLFHCLSCYCCN